MNFNELKQMIRTSASTMSFEKAGEYLEEQIFALSKEELIPLIFEIGIIPEDIPQDSSEEKLYAKTADIVLAKSFQELGLCASVIKTRADCADVIAKSRFHSYSLIGDAKTFRLSRTAKNQKDFKVQSMVHWKGDREFAVLVCPFFQYPRSYSQIYTQSLDGNILLWSWEHLSFLLLNSIEETEILSLAAIWNSPGTIASQYSRADKKIIFWDKQDALLCGHLHLDPSLLGEQLLASGKAMISRGNNEIRYYENEIEKIKRMTREQAIAELIKTMKVNEKISSIRNFISCLKGWFSNEYGCYL